jgi:hypothetical protein
MDQLSGQLVDLVDVLGAAGRRLAEQLRQTPSWPGRFALLDQFLLGRLNRGPRPSPEVGRAWQRLVATGGAVPIRGITHDEWAAARKKHLAKEKDFTRLRDQLSRERRELPWKLTTSTASRST